jgi:hypothetical protein
LDPRDDLPSAANRAGRIARTASACFVIASSRTIKPFGLAASGPHASAADLSFSSH